MVSQMPDRDQPGAVWRVEFRLRNKSHPFVRASDEEDCRVELAKMIPRGDGEYAEFFSVTGAEPGRIATLTDTHGGVDVTLLRRDDDGGLFEFRVSEACPAVDIAELGGLPREVVGVDGRGRLVAEIPAQYDTPAVVGTFLDEHPDAELVAKQETEAVTPIFPQSALENVLHRRLTDRQREVLRTAFELGYYDWPRACSGEDVASELDIASATFSEHIHAAERNLLAALFERQWTA